MMIIGTVERIYIRENKPALKGSNIQLVCEISQFSNSDVLHVYKRDSRLPSSLAGINPDNQCAPSICLTTSIGRYTFSADNSNVFINISSVNRSEDQKWWTCTIGNQRRDMLLNVISMYSLSLSLFLSRMYYYYYKGIVERIYIRDKKPALKGSNIQLVCEISGFGYSNLVGIYKSDIRLSLSLAGITSLTACIPQVCLTTTIVVCW
jgi:hypothetical protein